MSCNTCQAKFSFFTKDIGCPSCGFSYCNKCLKYKCDVPNVGTKKVCGRCYSKLNNMRKSSSEEANMTNAVVFDEPLASVDITMKLDSLENPGKPPIVMYKRTNHWDKLKKGLEPADQQIVDRLQKLKDKEKNIPLPTVEEIRQRLALLKDQDSEASGSNVINVHQVDTRTDQEKADDLIQEYVAQLELPSSSDPCKEIQERLNSLQDGDKTVSGQMGKLEMQNKYSRYKIATVLGLECLEQHEINEFLYKHQIFDLTDPDNAELSNKDSAMAMEDEDEDDDDENECVMCSHNAKEMDLYRCMGCTGDLYCSACFESSHDEDEMAKHKAVRFVKQQEKDTLSSEKMNLIQKLTSKLLRPKE